MVLRRRSILVFNCRLLCSTPPPAGWICRIINACTERVNFRAKLNTFELLDEQIEQRLLEVGDHFGELAVGG